jgi:hypothetical protein
MVLIPCVLYMTVGRGKMTRAENITSTNDDKELLPGPDSKQRSWNLRTGMLALPFCARGLSDSLISLCLSKLVNSLARLLQRELR